jgi:tetratricopeptide (TPR) repeat protein
LDELQPEEKEEQARVYFSLGAGHYRVGEYDAAIAAFQAGYRLAPLPLFLFNIAQSSRRAGNSEMAIEYYQKYIESETLPSAPQLAEARLQIDQLLSTRPPPSQPPAPEMAAKPAPAPPPAVVTTRPTPAAAREPQRSPPRERARQHGWIWGTIAGVAAAGLAVGLGLGLGLPPNGPRSSLGTVTF